jgi:hypothetical protein
MLLRKALQMQ